MGGTSWATPLFSGIVAIADQAAGHRLGVINPTLYDRLAGRHGGSGIVDVTLGDNTFTSSTPTGPRFTVPASRPSRVTTWRAASARSTPRRVAQLAKRARRAASPTRAARPPRATRGRG